LWQNGLLVLFPKATMFLGFSRTQLGQLIECNMIVSQHSP